MGQNARYVAARFCNRVRACGGKAEFYYKDKESTEASVVTWLKGKAGIS